MKKKTAIVWAILAATAVGGIVVFLMMRGIKVENPVANVYLNGELVYTLPLDEDAEVRVESENGYNVVKVENGEVRISEADCPDLVCVRTGAISGGTVPIVCLPHRVEIKVSSNSEQES